MPFPLDIKVGDLAVAASGSVVAFEGETIGFILGDEKKTRFEIVLKEDKAEEKNQVRFDIIDEENIRLSLINPDNYQLGATITDRIHLGTVGERKLFFLYSIQKIGKSPGVNALTYTFYLGEAQIDKD